jgi:hypothetical protein
MTSFPLPTTGEVLDVVAEQKPVLLTALDLKAGYWQIKMHEPSFPKIFFATTDGNYSFLRLAQGVRDGFQTFQRVMQKVLKGLSPTQVLIFKTMSC